MLDNYLMNKASHLVTRYLSSSCQSERSATWYAPKRLICVYLHIRQSQNLMRSFNICSCMLQARSGLTMSTSQHFEAPFSQTPIVTAEYAKRDCQTFWRLFWQSMRFQIPFLTGRQCSLLQRASTSTFQNCQIHGHQHAHYKCLPCCSKAISSVSTTLLLSLAVQ